MIVILSFSFPWWRRLTCRHWRSRLATKLTMKLWYGFHSLTVLHAGCIAVSFCYVFNMLPLHNHFTLFLLLYCCYVLSFEVYSCVKIWLWDVLYLLCVMVGNQFGNHWRWWLQTAHLQHNEETFGKTCRCYLLTIGQERQAQVWRTEGVLCCCRLVFIQLYCRFNVQIFGTKSSNKEQHAVFCIYTGCLFLPRTKCHSYKNYL